MTAITPGPLGTVTMKAPLPPMAHAPGAPGIPAAWPKNTVPFFPGPTLDTLTHRCPVQCAKGRATRRHGRQSSADRPRSWPTCRCAPEWQCLTSAARPSSTRRPAATYRPGSDTRSRHCHQVLRQAADCPRSLCCLPSRSAHSSAPSRGRPAGRRPRARSLRSGRPPHCRIGCLPRPLARPCLPPPPGR